MKAIMQCAGILFMLCAPNAAHGWTFPVQETYTITNGFWECAHHCYHLGTDIVPVSDTADPATEIHAICSGTVKFARPVTRYGTVVLIQCNSTGVGTITSLYGHLGQNTALSESDDVYVSVGDWVDEGTVIGRLGKYNENGGFVPHLHLGISKGPYQAVRECGAWRYAGYTPKVSDKTVSPADACYCDVMDNWLDPMEVLGLKPKDLRIVEGSVTPQTGIIHDTEFTWRLSAQGGRGNPIKATVILRNPISYVEYPFVMAYVAGTSNPFQFEYKGKALFGGEYMYRFKLETCAETVEETTRRSGPSVGFPELTSCDVPAPEICNNYDDDCNGQVDENLTRSCTNECGHTGTQSCSRGAWGACNAQSCPQACTPSSESCDGRDNDCDGDVDEGTNISCSTACGTGVRVCDVGRYLPCTAQQPGTETCNNRDDDCDGQVDENLTRSCSNSCGNTGTQYCTWGTWSACNAQACPPPPPVCTPATCSSLGKQCGSWSNGCGSTLNCGGCTSPATCNSSGQCVTSQQPPPPPPTCTPSTEVCDGRDNDCDGSVDESLTRSCTNECGNSGSQSCSGGSWSTCNAQACSSPPPPPPACTPATCSSLGKQCGSWSNGCGSTLNCGGCTSPATCNSSGQCVTPPACGGNNQPCCAGGTCNISGARSACYGGTCNTCGATWELCCPGSNPCSAAPRAFCKAETRTCWACGEEGTDCCSSSPACNSGLYCDPSTNHCAR